MKEKLYPILSVALEIAEKEQTLRVFRWHGPEGYDHWTVLEWAGAMAGEAGEAANVAKKIRRVELDMSSKIYPTGKLNKDLGDELADTFWYIMALAKRENIDLARHIVDKFNEVSERSGFPEKL